MTQLSTLSITPAFLSANMIPQGSLAHNFADMLMSRGSDVYQAYGSNVLVHDITVWA